MTEREKMLAGELYDCGDQELLTQWHKAKNLIREYNNLVSENLTEKTRILSELLGGYGTNLWITAPFYADYGNNIFFGNNCEVNMNCTFLDDNKIIIGDNALICKTRTAPVKIGSNVWIGGGAIILPGVSIGNNVVIGAGSIVTRNIPDNVIAFGNPCKIIRENI